MRRIASLVALALLTPGCGPGRRGADPAVGVARVAPEHYAYSIAALGFPGAQRAFQVGPGSVVSTGESALEWRLPDERGPIRTSPVWFERDGVPIAHWWMVSSRESLDFEAAAVPEAAFGDSSLMLSVRVTASARTAEPVEMALEARVRGRPDGPGFVPWDAGDDDGFDEAWDGTLAIRNDRVVAAVDAAADRGDVPPSVLHPAHTAGFGPGALAARCQARLVPGTHATWTFWMPAYPLPSGTAQKLERSVRHERVAARARERWRDWLAKSASLETPDVRVNAAWRAALVTLIQCQERRGAEWVPVGSPFQDREVTIRDAARTVRALAVGGLTSLAREDAWTLRHFQLAEGVLLSQRGQLDGTGQALWALEQAASLPPSAGWSGRCLAVAEAGLRWIEGQRLATRDLKLPWRGLLPFAEPPERGAGHAQLVANDAWALAGCRATAALARRAGRAELAHRADSSSAEYRVAILAALRRAPGPVLPAAWQGGVRDGGNLSLGYPTRLLAPDDPRLARLAARVRGARGGPDSASHVDPGLDLAQTALLAGRAAEARATLGTLLARMSSTFGLPRQFERAGVAFGDDLPPHAAPAAGLVDLVRNMLVSDTRDTLELGLGGALAWWAGTRFVGAPTRFGMLDLALDRPAPDRLEARWTAVHVMTRARIPDGVRAVEALSPGTRIVRGVWAECAPGATSLRVRVVPVVGRARR